MKKTYSSLIIAFAVGIAATSAFAGVSKSQSFQLSVTLPASINMPAEQQQLKAKTQSKETTSVATETSLVETVRNHQPIMIKSIVVR